MQPYFRKLSFKKQKFEQYKDYYISNIELFKRRLNELIYKKENEASYIYSKQYYAEFKLICSYARYEEYFKILDRVEKTTLPLEERNRLRRDAYDLFKERGELAYTHTLTRNLKNTKYSID